MSERNTSVQEGEKGRWSRWTPMHNPVFSVSVRANTVAYRKWQSPMAKSTARGVHEGKKIEQMD